VTSGSGNWQWQLAVTTGSVASGSVAATATVWQCGRVALLTEWQWQGGSGSMAEWHYGRVAVWQWQYDSMAVAVWQYGRVAEWQQQYDRGSLAL
jgi:hypothetical protein